MLGLLAPPLPASDTLTSTKIKAANDNETSAFMDIYNHLSLRWLLPPQRDNGAVTNFPKGRGPELLPGPRAR